MNIHFQIAGLIIILYLSYLYISRRSLRLKEEKTFSVILLLTFVDLVLDTLSVVAIHFGAYLPKWLVSTSCKSYIICMMWLGMADFCYVMLGLKKDQKKHNRMVAILACFTLAASVLTALLPIEIHNDAGSVYTAGPAVLSVYAVTLFYILSTMLGALYIRRHENSRRGQAVIVTTSFWLIAAGIQYLNNAYLVVGFASAVGVMILYIVLENPDANLDRQLGCLNSFALNQYLDRKMKESTAFHILDISIRDIRILEDLDIDVQAKTKDVIKLLERENGALLFKDFSYGLIVVSDQAEIIESVEQKMEKWLEPLDNLRGEVLMLQVKNVQRFGNVGTLQKFLTSIREESSNYECLLLVDLETGCEDHFRIADDFARMIPAWETENDFARRVNMLSQFVSAEDRDAFVHSANPRDIREKLSSSVPYLIDFRVNVNGRELWYQMKAVRTVTGNENACAVIGIRNNDAFMRTKLLEQQNREAVLNITMAISEDYECMFHVDFNSCREEHYRTGEKFIREIPGWDTEMNYLRHMEMLKSIVVAEDREEFLEAVKPEAAAEKVKTGVPYYIDFRVTLDGEIHWYQIKMLHHLAHKGHNCAIVGIANIDEMMAQKARNEEVLKQNLSLIEGLASDYTNILYLNLENGTFTNYITGRGRVMQYDQYAFGYDTFDEAFSAYAHDAIYESEQKRMIDVARTDHIRNRLMRETSFTEDYRTVSDGHTAFCQMRVAAVGEKDGSPTAAAVGFSYNDAEVALNYIDENLRREYVELYLIDLENNEYRCFLRSSHLSLDQNTRGVFTEILAQYAQFVEPEYREIWDKLVDLNYFRDYLSTEDRRELVYPILGKEREWRRAVMQVVERKNGIATLFIFTFQQIDSERAERLTLLETIEKQQRALEEALSMAQSANRAKTTFLNNMSHDIRTPMNAIIGYTGLAATHIDSRETVAEYLKKISQSSEHLLSLINDILDMSRIESGKMTLNEQEESLSEIVHTIRSITQSGIAAKNLDFYVDVCDIEDEFVICDKLRLNQVLLNILSNAIKYTPAGGSIFFKIAEHGARADGYAAYSFSVRDTGIGMSEEFINTIFEPFTRVKSSTVSGIQGTGLGMAITKNIVDMMGGTINIRSEENIGTEVVVEFEFKLADAKENEDIPETLMKFRGLRGLVVDDDLDSCVNITKMLKNISIRSEWCSSGKEAVFRAQAAHDDSDDFSVYIIDWMMPDMNGVETVRRIRKVIGNYVPIIIVTAYDWADIEKEAYDAGVTAFVNKPLFMSDLKKTLIRCCEPELEENVEEKPDYSGKRILLVEDNEMNREIACEILREYGFIIDTAEDGTIAVEKMENAVPGQYDLILMDIQMPLMDGYEATKRIRALSDPEIANISIIAMTANAFEEDRKLAIAAGMNEHIAKPVDVQKLIALLSQILK